MSEQLDQTGFYLDRLEPMVGGRVVGLFRTGKDEEFGDEFYGLTVKCKDGKVRLVIFLRDDEGNGPGSFDVVIEGEDHE